MRQQRDQPIREAIERDAGRLRNFILSRVLNRQDAEDILQDVFYELLTAYTPSKRIDHVGAWLFRAARNRIIDLWRKKSSQGLSDLSARNGRGDTLPLEDVLPSSDAGPEAAYARKVLIEEIEEALGELPAEQREVFIAHELEGRSFKELAAATGVGVNTLLSRKHYAVLHLRQRLRSIYEDFTKG